MDLLKEIFVDLKPFTYEQRTHKHMHDILDGAIQVYYVPGATWYDDESWVGLSVMYFNSEPIAIINQLNAYGIFGFAFCNQDKYFELMDFLKGLADDKEWFTPITMSVYDFIDNEWFKEFAENPEDYINEEN